MATVVVESRRRARRPSLLSSPRNNSQIYLYEGNSEDDSSPPPITTTNAAATGGQKQWWTCAVCTFINNPEYLACDVCTLPIGALPLKSEYQAPGNSKDVLRVINREEAQMNNNVHRTRSRSAGAGNSRRSRHSLTSATTIVASEGRHSADIDGFRISRGSYSNRNSNDNELETTPISDSAIRYGGGCVSPTNVTVVPTAMQPRSSSERGSSSSRRRPTRMSAASLHRHSLAVNRNLNNNNRRSRSCHAPKNRPLPSSQSQSPPSAISEFFYLCSVPQGEQDPKWQRVLGWLHAHKTTAKEHPALQPSEDDARKTALHVVCTRQPPISVVQKLLKLSAPECVKTKDAYGWLPLHHACKHGSPEGVMYLLIKAFPEAITCVDRWKRGPLHLLFLSTERAVHPDPIRMLLKESIACYGDRAPSALVQINANISILGLADENGKLPIHYAVKHHASMDVIDLLLREYPLSLTICDVRGYSPVDVAVGRMTSSTSYFLTLKKMLSPQVVAKLKADDGDLPSFIKFLAEQPLKHVENNFDNIQDINKFFFILLETPPHQNMDEVRSALKSLPSWLQKYLSTTITWIHEQLMQRRRLSEALSETILKGLKKNRSASMGNKDRRFNSGTSVVTDASVSICPDNFNWRKPVAKQRSARQVC